MVFTKMRCVFVVLLLSCSYVRSDGPHSKPLVKRPKGTFKTLLSLDGGGLRNMISVFVLLEVEQSIKRYLLAHPDVLPKDAAISSVDDFDVDLADYFDVMTGNSAGGWLILYLASRGGQGFARRVLDDPAIVEKYGTIPSGSVEGMKIFFREYGGVIYPPDAYNLSAGPPLDLSNPMSTGVTMPVYSNEGIIETMETFVGNMTMAELDTTVVLPIFDVISGFTILFVTEVLGDVSVSYSGKMVPRDEPRLPNEVRFKPDLQINEANYYLKDLAAGSAAAPIANPAVPVSRVDNETVEFLCMDGVFPVDSAATLSGFFTAAQIGTDGFDKIAMMSVGVGGVCNDWSLLANAGLAGWSEGLALIRLFLISGRYTSDALLDYFYYSIPNTKPYQYLRIETASPVTTEEGMALAPIDLIIFLDVYEAIGARLAKDYRQSIEIFVRDFVFG